MMGRLLEIDPDQDYGSVNESVYHYILERDNNLCLLCGSAGQEIHHVVFKSKVGSNKTNNLALLCFRCHKDQHGVKRTEVSLLLDKIINNEKLLRRRLV